MCFLETEEGKSLSSWLIRELSPGVGSAHGQTNEWVKRLHFLFSVLVTWFVFTISKNPIILHLKGLFLLFPFWFVRPVGWLKQTPYWTSLSMPPCVQPGWTLPPCITQTQAERGLKYQQLCGGLNLAHEKCRWIRPLCYRPWKCLKAQVCCMSPTSERSVRQYTRRLQPEESVKKSDSSLLLPELQRCLTFAAWPSKAFAVFDPSLYFPLEFLSPSLTQRLWFWLTLQTLRLPPPNHSKIIVWASTQDENLRGILPLILKNILFLVQFCSTPAKSLRSFGDVFEHKVLCVYVASLSLLHVSQGVEIKE